MAQVIVARDRTLAKASAAYILGTGTLHALVEAMREESARIGKRR